MMAVLLHVVDEGMKFQAGRWLKSRSAKHTWEIIQNCWKNTYLGPPDITTNNAGTNYVIRDFQQYAVDRGLTTKGVQVEYLNFIGLVERYHGPLRHIYQIVVSKISGIEKNLALKMTFKALNNSLRADEFVSTLLIFGAYLRAIETEESLPEVTERKITICIFIRELERIRASPQVHDALNTLNFLSTTQIHKVSVNSPALVWRESNSG